jgi:hypothetical protein
MDFFNCRFAEIGEQASCGIIPHSNYQISKTEKYNCSVTGNLAGSERRDLPGLCQSQAEAFVIVEKRHFSGLFR